MYFMRHGQSEFNVVCDATGQDPDMPDARLTDMGRDQARRAGKMHVHDGFVKIVSSPFKRAIETALLVGEHIGVAVEVDLLLSEHRLYNCDQGSPTDELRQLFPQVDFKDFDSEDWWVPFPESKRDFKNRVQDFEDKWREDKDWGKILFVSHYYFINSISGAYPDNTEVVRL